jgi:elongator complex protein 3
MRDHRRGPARPALDAQGLDRIVRRHPKHGRGLFSKSEIIAGFRAFADAAPAERPSSCARLRLRPVRTLSGVTPVTVLTKPYPVPGHLRVLPERRAHAEELPRRRARRAARRGQPLRSLSPDVEPARRVSEHGTPDRQGRADRARRHLVAPSRGLSDLVRRALLRRALRLRRGHRRARDGRRRRRRLSRARAARRPRDRRGAYNRAIDAPPARRARRRLLHASETATWDALAAAQRRNESAGARCVGLVLETRPDQIDAAETRRLRRLGATKIQLGVQSLDDAILRANLRGHDVAATRAAFRALRGAGFKLHAHWMPNLLGATPARDARRLPRACSTSPTSAPTS